MCSRADPHFFEVGTKEINLLAYLRISIQVALRGTTEIEFTDMLHYACAVEWIMWIALLFGFLSFFFPFFFLFLILPTPDGNSSVTRNEELQITPPFVQLFWHCLLKWYEVILIMNFACTAIWGKSIFKLWSLKDTTKTF